MAIGSFIPDGIGPLRLTFLMSMWAQAFDDLYNPWDSSDTSESIAYGRSGVSGNAQNRHTFLSFLQTGAQAETRPASISVYLCIKY
jgi:hypothetical protein